MSDVIKKYVVNVIFEENNMTFYPVGRYSPRYLIVVHL